MIKLIPYPNSSPQSLADYEKQNALLQAAFLGGDRIPAVRDNQIVQGSIFQIAGPVFVAETDTEITGEKSDYVKISVNVDGDRAAAEFVPDLAGVMWNPIYNGYYDADGNLYLFDEGKAHAAGQVAELNRLNPEYLRAHGDQKIYGRLTLEDTNLIKWGAIKSFGTPLSVADLISPALTALNSRDFVLADGNDSLTAYRFDGTNFSQIGESLSVPDLSSPALTALNSRDFVLANNYNSNLTAIKIEYDLDLLPKPHSVAGGAF